MNRNLLKFRAAYARRKFRTLTAFAAAAMSLAAPEGSNASIAYGSINNFDTVNDTGSTCHGFEIELDDCRSTDITYTYNYNHYGVPKITQDDSLAGHPRCIIRWESRKNADGSWASYTAIPSGPVSPTDGHMFTNPAVNFGGEHFGVGYTAPPSAVRYHWLIDNGVGSLIQGGAVQVATPVFTYYPPVPGNAAPAQVLAVIQPPEPPEVPVKEFGEPVWVKEIRTTSHNSREVKLRDLVSDDPDDDADRNWKNGEPDEVEVEWELLQTEFSKADGGAKGKHAAAPEDLDQGDEVVTRRYEFYKYTGPLDNESGEAATDSVGIDGVHGTGVATVNGVDVDLSTVAIVGEFTGAQMAAVDVDARLGLIDHVSGGMVGEAYADRTLVVQGALPFTCIREGGLPAGMDFDPVTGILSGTPEVSGEFLFNITVSDGRNPEISRNFILNIAPAGEDLAPLSIVDTTVSPPGSGLADGDGSFAPGTEVTVTASANPGFRFLCWTDNGIIVSDTPDYQFVIDVNHSLTANFTAAGIQHSVSTGSSPGAGGTTAGGGTADEGSSITITASPAAGYEFLNWAENGTVVSTLSSWTFTLFSDRSLIANFAAAGTFNLTLAASPAAGGAATGGGVKTAGSLAVVTAVPAAGYSFVNWKEGAVVVSSAPAYSFTMTADRTLTAYFQAVQSGSTTIKAADEYEATDITGWTGEQLAELPYFDRYVPLNPEGAPADFAAVARNGFGSVAGNRAYSTDVIQGISMLVSPAAALEIDPWGRYTWTDSVWNGHENEVSVGVVSHSVATDVALSGRVIGFASMHGTGSGPDSAVAWSDHGYLWDPESGTKSDITPAADRADPRSINDHDVIVGTWKISGVSHPFKRMPDGTLDEYTAPGFSSVTPVIVTNRGLVAGDWTGPAFRRPFVCSAGMAPASLPLPSPGGFDSGSVVDACDHALLVGYAYKAASPLQRTAVRWYLDKNVWVAQEINRVNATGGVIIDECLAVNDAGYIIALGHAAGTDLHSSRTLLLTPDKLPPPSVITLAADDITSTSARLRAKVNACRKTAAVTFHTGASSAYGVTRSSAPAGVEGDAPVLCTAELGGLTPHTAYHFRASAVSSKGTTHGDDFTFTTAWDFTSWSAAKLAAAGGDPALLGADADYDHDGESNFGEYAFGFEPAVQDGPPEITAFTDPETGLVSMSFRKPADRSGINYVVEVAFSPSGPWHSGPGYTEEVSAIPSGNSVIIKSRSLLPESEHPRQFLRVTAESR